MILAQHTFYREITIDNTGGAERTNYPVKLTLTSSNFTFANAQADGSDIQVAISTGRTVAPHWVESWNPHTEEAVVWVKVPSMPAGGTTTLRLYFGGDGDSTRSNIAQVFPAGIDFTEPGVLEGKIDDESVVSHWGWNTLSQTPLASVSDISGATGIREQDDIVYDPNDPNQATNPERLYKFYLTAQTSSAREIHVVFSADGFSWGLPQKCTMGATDRSSEDPSVTTLLFDRGQVYRDGSNTRYMYVEDKDTGDIYVYESTDGLSFTEMSGNPVISTAASSWEDSLVGSPGARHDGTNFHIIYEGIETGTTREYMGVASGSTANSLTKNPNNPVWDPRDTAIPDGDSIVADSFFLNSAGDKIVIMAHDGKSSGGTMFRGVTSNLDPSTWDSDDIDSLATTNDSLVRNDYTLDNSSEYTRVITGNPADSELGVARVSSRSRTWAFDEQSNSTRTYQQVGTGANTNDIVGQQLVLRAGNSNPSGNDDDYYLALWTPADIGLASDFQIVARVKQEEDADSSNARYADIGFGTGEIGVTLETGIETGFAPGIASGYMVQALTPGGTGQLLLDEVDASRNRTNLTSGDLGETDATTLNQRTVTYLADGSLSITIGNSTASTTDTTFLAGNKKIYLAQGQRRDFGGKQTIDWVYARPYDGSDPSVTVGSETTAPSLAPRKVKAGGVFAAATSKIKVDGVFVEENLPETQLLTQSGDTATTQNGDLLIL